MWRERGDCLETNLILDVQDCQLKNRPLSAAEKSGHVPTEDLSPDAIVTAITSLERQSNYQP